MDEVEWVGMGRGWGVVMGVWKKELVGERVEGEGGGVEGGCCGGVGVVLK